MGSTSRLSRHPSAAPGMPGKRSGRAPLLTASVAAVTWSLCCTRDGDATTSATATTAGGTTAATSTDATGVAQDVGTPVDLSCPLDTLPDLGEYFSRGLDRPVSGKTDWVNAQTPFFLETGQNPDNVKLNTAVKSTSTVWIDQLELEGVPVH